MIFLASTQSSDVLHAASSPICLCTPGFEVRNRETLENLRLGRTWPIFSILASRGPTHQALGSLGGGFEPKPPKPPSNIFVPCTRVGASQWHPASPVHRSCLAVHRRAYTAVAKPPLRVPSSHGRPTLRLASGPLEDFCLSPLRSSSSSTSSPSEGLSSLTITHHTRRAMRPIHWLSISPLMSALSTHLQPVT